MSWSISHSLNFPPLKVFTVVFQRHMFSPLLFKFRWQMSRPSIDMQVPTGESPPLPRTVPNKFPLANILLPVQCYGSSHWRISPSLFSVREVPTSEYPPPCSVLGKFPLANIPLSVVPAGSPSRSGDVTVYVLDKNQPSLPTLFFIQFLCLFLSLKLFQELYFIP